MLRFWLTILLLTIKDFMKVMYRFFYSSDSTILSGEFYESDVSILRFFQLEVHRKYITFIIILR